MVISVGEVEIGVERFYEVGDVLGEYVEKNMEREGRRKNIEVGSVASFDRFLSIFSHSESAKFQRRQFRSELDCFGNFRDPRYSGRCDSEQE